MQVNVVPWLMDNPSIGFVQARWTFTNPEESYLTKARPLTLLLACSNIPSQLQSFQSMLTQIAIKGCIGNS